MNGGYALDAWHFLLPKDGSSNAECEDAVAENKRSLRFAIADGATEGFDSRAWARLLVARWLRVDPPAISAEDFQPLVRDLGVRLHERWKERPLPWYAEEKAKAGSFAAFLGVQFSVHNNKLSWTAIALGDCCLIHQRESRICAAFPISDSESFDSHPMLLPSVSWLQEKAFADLKILEGTAEEGDEFLLLSDAIAAWYLRETNDAAQLRDTLRAHLRHREHGELERMVGELRHQGAMRNDDVVALRIAAVRT